MLKSFSASMRNPRKFVSFCLCALLLVFAMVSPLLADPRIERDFMRLPDGRWIWLNKIDWDTTRVILGKGKVRSEKNIIWSKTFVGDDERSWGYAYFVYMSPGKLSVDLDRNGDSEVVIATYDMGNNMIRKILIFSVQKERMVFLREHGPINLAADEAAFK